MFMSRFDRYIMGYFWGYFIAGLLVFVTIFMSMDALSTLVSFKNISSETLVNFYLYYLPEVIQKMIPVACLLGAVMTLSVLNKNNELVALFSSGLSLFRIVLPILFSILFICVASFVMGDRLIPMMTKKKNYIYYNEIKRQPGLFSVIKTNRIWYRSKNSIFNIKTLNNEGTKAQGLTLYFFSEGWNLLQMITAEDVDLKGSQWDLKKGSITVFSANSSFPLTSEFSSKTILMSEEAKDLQSSGQTSDILTQKELDQFINKNKDAGLDTVRYEVDYHAKFSFAFAGFVMSLLGIPFSIGRARAGGMMVNIGISIALVFAYWVIYSSSLTLGNHGTLPPIFAAWAPNISMSILAYFLFLRLKR
jgi:lipopolysaccharide export system permease protein